MEKYKKPLHPWTFLILGVIVVAVSIWMNKFSFSGKFTVFLVTGILFIFYGFIKIPLHKKKKKTSKALNCPYCSNYVKDIDIFCPSCGRQLKAIPKG